MKRKFLKYLRLFITTVLLILFIGNLQGYTVAQTPPSSSSREVTAIAFSPDGGTLAAGVSDTQIAVIDVKTGNVNKILPGHLGTPVRGAVFSPDGKTLLTVGKDTVVRLWDVTTGKESQILQGPENSPRTLVISPDGKSLFSSGEDPRIFKWDLTTNKLSKIFTGHQNFVNSLALSPDGKILASADQGSVVILWNANTGEQLKTLVGHQDAVTGLAFSPDGTNLATVSQDRTARLWDVANAKAIKVFSDATQPLRKVAFSPDGQNLIAGGDEKTLFVWNAKFGGLRLRLNTFEAITGVAISPDGTRFATASKKGDVNFGNLNSGVLQRTVQLNNLLPILPQKLRINSQNRNKILKTPNKVQTSTADATIKTSKSTLLAAIPSPPGGPILVVTSTANRFSDYYAEILRTEGLNFFNVSDISSISSATLANYDIVILSEMTLTSAQVTMFNDWVTGGGNLITMRPDKKLAGLLGLTDAASTLDNAYLLVDNSTSAGKGIVSQTMQFHGTADRYNLNGATSIATLYTNATTSTANPALTLRNVGSNGGQAAAFTYDLARSIVYTRQGNPAWAAQERDGFSPIRPDDQFFGNKSGDSQPDWIDLNKVAIPQADEQQRLLANLILQLNSAKKPLPRFWYFPNSKKAVVLMTGDDHANGGTATRFDQFKSLSPAGCSVNDWQCIRGTSYIYPDSPLTNAQANQYVNLDGGFEVSLHLNTNCADYTTSSLATAYTEQLSSFTSKYTSIESPKTQRHHCLVWSDWFSTPQIEFNNGIRLDTTYYYWPPSWVADRPGFFTGSGMPMRFVNQDGTMIDVFGAPTQLTDESGQSYPFTIDTLLDRAIGTEGYYGVFNVNAHTDFATSSVGDAVVNSALARGVPIVSAKQMLAWLDGRNSSSFNSLAWNNNALSFTITKGNNTNGLQAMLPKRFGNSTLSNITLNGSPVSYNTDVIKGIDYAFFPGNSGSYVATYTGDTTPPIVSSTSPSSNATDVSTIAGITATFSEAIDSTTINSTNFQLLNSSNTSIAATVTYNATNRTATLTPNSALATSTSYTARIRGSATGVKDLAGNALAADYNWSFTTTANQPIYSIWNNSVTPSNPSASDTTAVELGVKFRANVNGFITGLRFYKGTNNTGTHIGSLWSSTGQQLATATFTNETAFGWQTVNFANPVQITANTVYVASYYAPVGGYAIDLGYFANSGVSNGPLYLLRDGESGGNGVYKNGSGFPDSTFQSANYWVDVLFAISIASDTTPPIVTATTPSNNATGVNTGTTITATFSEAIDSTTINTTNFELRNSSNVVVPATVTYNATTRTATLTPNSALPNSTTHTARIRGGATGVKDLAGNALTVDYTWSFTSAGDTTPPTVISTSPSSNATGVNTATTITATFSEAIDSTTINTTNFELRNSSNVVVPATVTYNATTRTATLTPNSALANSTTHTARIRGGVTGVKDLAGNALTVDYTWSFTSAGDTTPPTVISTSPSINATGISTATAITATFSEAINSTTINTTNFELRNSSNVVVPATMTYNATTRTATLTPSSALANSTTYTARIRGGATGVKDLAGNALTVDYTWSFTSVRDTTPPTVISTSPSNNAIFVTIFSNMTATFSEPIDPTTINTTNFELRTFFNLIVVPTSVTYNSTNRTVTLKPILLLTSLTNYTVRIKGGSTGVKDLAGNALTTDYNWSFTTGLF